MEQSVREYVSEKVKELMSAPSCCAEAKTTCENWLKAAGTDQEAEQTKKLIAELEMDIMPVDGLIAFAGSEIFAKKCGAIPRIEYIMSSIVLCSRSIMSFSHQ